MVKSGERGRIVPNPAGHAVEPRFVSVPSRPSSIKYRSDHINVLGDTRTDNQYRISIALENGGEGCFDKQRH